MEREKIRLEWLDVAKGLAISFVVLIHVVSAIDKDLYVNAPAFFGAFRVFFNTISSFYMPAFFVITGLCSSFDADARSFVLKQFKQLQLPFLTLGLLFNLVPLAHFDFSPAIRTIVQFLSGGAWFLTALFFSKLILFFSLKRLSLKNVGLVFVALFALGCGLTIVGYDETFWLVRKNFWWIRMDLTMPIFLFLGYFVRVARQRFNLDLLNWKFGMLSGAAFLTASCIYYWMDVRPPCIIWDIFIPNPFSAIMVLLLGATGSLLFLSFVKNLVPKSSVLSLFGKCSLVIYLIHGDVYYQLMRYTDPMLVNQGGIIRGVLMIFAATMFICCFIAGLLNWKYARLVLGKF